MDYYKKYIKYKKKYIGGKKCQIPFKFNHELEIDKSIGFHPIFLYGTLNNIKDEYQYLSPLNGYILNNSGYLEYLYKSKEDTGTINIIRNAYIFDKTKALSLNLSISDRNIFFNKINSYTFGLIIGEIVKYKMYEPIEKKTFLLKFKNIIMNNTEINDYFEFFITITRLEKYITSELKNNKTYKYIKSNLEIIKNIIKKYDIQLPLQLPLIITENTNLREYNYILNILNELNNIMIERLEIILKKSMLTQTYEKSSSISKEIYNKILEKYEKAKYNKTCTHKTITRIKSEINTFLNNLFNSLMECEYLNKNGKKYFKNFTYTILLSILIFKCNSRNDIIEYFQGLKDSGIDIMKEGKNIDDMIYNINISNNTLLRINKIPNINIKTLIDTNIELFCYKKIMNCYYNKVSPLVYQKNNLMYKETYITDCNETVIINLLNLCAYNKNNLTYNIENIVNIIKKKIPQ